MEKIILMCLVNFFALISSTLANEKLKISVETPKIFSNATSDQKYAHLNNFHHNFQADNGIVKFINEIEVTDTPLINSQEQIIFLENSNHKKFSRSEIDYDEKMQSDDIRDLTKLMDDLQSLKSGSKNVKNSLLLRILSAVILVLSNLLLKYWNKEKTISVTFA